MIDVNFVYIAAKNGGRHYGKYKDAMDWDDFQLKRASRNYQKQIDEHIEKVSNPAKYIDNWESLDIRQRQGLIKKWNKDIIRNAEEKAVMQGLLKERGIEINE